MHACGNQLGLTSATLYRAIYEEDERHDDPVTINNLAVCYRDGAGIEKDPNKAFALFGRAAEKDHAPSIYCLAVCYRDGVWRWERSGQRFCPVRARG